MSELLYLDKTEESQKMSELLKGLHTMKIFMIDDPKSVDFPLPVLFTEWGSFSSPEVKDYILLKEFYKK